LGEAKYLGCPRLETPKGLPTKKKRSATTAAKGATTKARSTTTIPTAVPRGGKATTLSASKWKT
jgi:hypothetical protein